MKNLDALSRPDARAIAYTIRNLSPSTVTEVNYGSTSRSWFVSCYNRDDPLPLHYIWTAREFVLVLRAVHAKAERDAQVQQAQ